MSKVALNVVIECKPELRDEVIQSLLDHRERCLKDEPGTLQFEVMVPDDIKSKIFLFELYTDSSALSAHSKGASMVRYIEEVKGKVLKAEVNKCSVANVPTR